MKFKSANEVVVINCCYNYYSCWCCP